MRKAIAPLAAAALLIGIANGQNAQSTSSSGTAAPQSDSAVLPIEQRPHGPMRVSGQVMLEYVKQKVASVTLPDAKGKHLHGTVPVHIIISKEGKVEEATATGGPEPLRKSAVDCIRQWTFQPYLLGNEPTAIDTTLNVVFKK